MRLLLDTHVVLWWFANDHALGDEARRAILDTGNDTFVSALTLAEIAIKQSIGKLDAPYISDDLIEEQGMTPLSFSPRHGRKVVELPLEHRDPFDRMLIAQAQEEGLTVVTADRRFRDYVVPVMWASNSALDADR